MSEETLGHDLGGAENVATDDDVDVGSVLQSQRRQYLIEGIGED